MHGWKLKVEEVQWGASIIYEVPNHRKQRPAMKIFNELVQLDIYVQPWEPFRSIDFSDFYVKAKPPKYDITSGKIKSGTASKKITFFFEKAKKNNLKPRTKLDYINEQGIYAGPDPR